jgi:DNA-binding NarL/FixJ family response regulator
VKLTPRQRGVAALIAQGLTNLEIAERLGLAEGTVKLHIANALHETGLRNRVELAVAWLHQTMCSECGEDPAGVDGLCGFCRCEAEEQGAA